MIKILRFWNVFVRSLAREIGSDSFVLAPGYLSTSSSSRKRMALLARFEGELEPSRLRYIPSNCSSSFLLLFAWYRSRSAGEASIMGTMRFLATLSASTSEGYTTIVGDGSC